MNQPLNTNDSDRIMGHVSPATFSSEQRCTERGSGYDGYIKRPHEDGLSIIVNKYEREIAELRKRTEEAEGKFIASESSRRYILGVLNFIKSSAYGIQTPGSEPDHRNDIEGKFDGGFTVAITGEDVVNQTIANDQADHL